MLPPQRTSATRTRHTAVSHTPTGDLTWPYDADDGIETEWDMIKPVNSTAAVDKMPSVPHRFAPRRPMKLVDEAMVGHVLDRDAGWG